MKNRNNLLAALVIGAGFTARADSLVYGYDTAYTDKYTPAGEAPWIQATFTDIEKGVIKLEVKALSLSKDEFVSTWGFNVNPELDPTTFDFELISSFNYDSKESTVFTKGQDSVSAGGSVALDFDLNFGNHTFGVGSDVVFYIKSDKPLSVADFYFATEGKKSGYYSAAHIQGLADGKSAWVEPTATFDTGEVVITPVPEASTLAAIGFVGAVAGFGFVRARRQVKK
ncbi:MAG TPA: hypothetical protein VMF06_19610 [Candidatus Limnocylindria bacterium]|nr:hypothetical protein [Candidatus Limnocylindria bacterium]